MSRGLLGYQVADRNGVNIQGEDADPSGHPSFHVMDADEASSFLLANPKAGFLLMPIYEGDIERPSFK